MTGIWLVSYIVLWLLVLGGGAVILILAREIEALHARLESIERRKSRADASPADVSPSVVNIPAGD
jgi:hypothetical protein